MDEPQSPTTAAMAAVLDGCILQVPYSNERNWHVLLVRTADGGQVRATGTLTRPVVGTSVKFNGRFTDGSRRTFVIDSSAGVVQQSTAAIVGHLVQVLGVDPATAGKIAGQFGPRTLEILDTSAERLKEVPGITDPAQLAAHWNANRQRELGEAKLLSHGLGIHLSERLASRLGADPASACQRNPYLPFLLFDEIGFDHIDRLARKGGMGDTDAPRLAGGIVAALRRRRMGGHTYIERAALSTYVQKELGLSKPPESDGLTQGITLCIEAAIVREDPGRLALKYLVDLEILVADRLKHLTDTVREVKPLSAERLIALAERSFGEKLPNADAVKIEHVLAHKLAVLHGVGASQMTRLPVFLATSFHLLQASVVLVLPNTASANRYNGLGLADGMLQSLDGLLGRRPDGSCAFHSSHPLPHEVVIVADADRMTLPDFAALVAAVQNSTSLYFIGDSIRLPPTGPGQPFADLITTRYIMASTLPESSVFVPKEARALVTQLKLLHKGRPPLPVNPDDTTAPILYFPLSRAEAGAIEQTLEVLGREVLPVLMTNFDAVRDLLFISPSRKALPGVPSLPQLNRYLAEVFKPKAQRVMLPATHGELYGPGDPVFVRRGDDAIGLKFGERGVIEIVDARAQELSVTFQGSGTVQVPFARAASLTLGYATTAYQISGFQPRCAIGLFLSGHNRLLNLELLYTTLSSATERAIILAEPEALEKALTTEGTVFRDMQLPELLRALPRPVSASAA